MHRSVLLSAVRYPARLVSFAALMFLAATAFLAGGTSASRAQTQTPFAACTSTMYLSIGANPTQLHSVDTSTNPFTFPTIGSPDNPGYNGIGYNPTDNFIYSSIWDPDAAGGAGRHILQRIDSNGVVREFGVIAGGGINTDAAPAGGVDNYRRWIASGTFGTDGFLYLKHNQPTDRMWRVDVSDPNSPTATAIVLDEVITQGDISWHNGLIYAANHDDGYLYSIDPDTGDVDPVGLTGLGAGSDTFGSMISATNGIFGRLNTGGFYQFDPVSGDATLISDSPSDGGDGAKCPTTAVLLDADLEIDKDDSSETYDRGGEVEYTILVSNNGPFGVQNALVNDALPDGITSATWTCDSPTNGAVCNVANGTGDIVDAAVNLPAESSVTFTLTMDVPLNFSGELTNTATVTNPEGFSDPTPANNTDSDTDIAAPLLTLEKQVTNDDGGTLTTVDFMLSADGPETISGVSGSADVTDAAVPAGTYTLSETNQPGYTASDYSCVVDGGAPVSGNAITLDNEQVAVCTITNDDEPGTLTLRKTLVNNDGGIAGVEDFILTASGPANISGPTGDPAVTDAVIPAGSYALGETGPAGYTAGTYRCAIDGGAPVASNSLNLGSGQSAVCTITNDDIPPDVSINKALVDESIADDVFPQDGEFLTYEITLTNTGGTASNYEIADILDGNVVFQNASHGGTLAGNEVQWTLTVPAQDGGVPGTMVLQVVVQVINPLPPGEQVVNSAKTPTEPPPPCPSAQCVVLPPPPFVESEKQLVAEGGSTAGVAEPGEQLTYQITLRNSGSTTSDYDHRDLLDPNTNFVSADSSGAHSGGSPGGQVDWTDLTVPGGTPTTPGVLTLEVVVTVVDPIPGGVSRLTNIAYDPTKPEPECPAPQCVTTPVPGVVDKEKLLISEDGSRPGVAEPGERLTYEITLTNSGGPVTGYEIEDRLDPNTDFISASDGGTESGGTVTWSGLAIDAYSGTTPGERVLTVVVEVHDPLDPGVVQLTNIVGEPGETVDCQQAPQQCVTTQTAPQITKLKELVNESGTMGDVAEPGETLTYRITVTNEGGADPAYQVQDLLDPNTTFTGADNGGQLMGDHVAWTLDVPAHDGTNPGVRVVTVTVRVDDPIAEGVTQLTNIAREPGETIDCQVTPTPPECVITQTGPNVSSQKLLVAENGSTNGLAEPREELIYEITLTNTGGVAHSNYGLIDAYGSNVTVVNAGGGTDEGSWIRWSGLTVPPQTGGTPGTLVLTVVTRVNDPLPSGITRLRNIIKRDPTDPDPECPSAQCVDISTTANITPVKRLVSEDGSVAGIAEPGEQLTYEITLTNEAGSTNDYAVEDVLDPNMVFVSADNGGVHSGGSSSGVVDWSGLHVPGHDGTNPGVLVLTAVVEVIDPLPDDAVSLRNIIREPGGADPDCPSDQCVTLEPQKPALTLLKEGAYEDSDGNGFANPGDTIRYSFTVTNTGNVPLSDVVPQDDGPLFGDIDGGGTLSDFAPSAATLQPGEERKFTASYTLAELDIDAAAGVENNVENTATAVGYANGTRVNGTPVESEESVTVLSLPAAASDVSVIKVAGLRAIRRGEQVPFTIRVTNNAGSLTEGLTVIDTMPSGFRYVEGSATIDDDTV
uniref:DUF6923 family protein n=1 Tax=Chelativorans sp. YIM 93263 TaxID=2906648 RepID=UPI002379C1E1